MIPPIKNITIYILVFLGFVSLFLFRFYIDRPKFEEGDLLRVTGTIQEDPVLVNGQQKIVVSGIRVYLPRFPEYRYGDSVVTEGVATQGKGGWFLKEPKIFEISERRGVQKLLFPLRERVLESFGKFLPEPHASLLKGIVLGIKSSLDLRFLEALINTGTLHIVVASGTNVSLLGGSALGIFGVVLGRRRAIPLVFLLIWSYVVLVGWQPPIVRAGIMGSVTFLAQGLGRVFDAWRALLGSAALMLLLQPNWIFDVGFQLSFTATAGMLLLTASICSKLLRVPNLLREDLSVTLAAQVAVAPILFFSFGQFSLISPFVNAFILWTVPIIMFGGMIMALLGIIWEPLAQIIAWFLWLPLEYFVRVIRIFS